MYIVTGGAGFIGSAVVWKLNQQGVDDILIVDQLGQSDKWKNLVNRRYRDYIHKDRFLKTVVGGGFEKVEAIIHMGACSATTETDADYLITNNFHYSKALAQYAFTRNIRFINASSAATYGDGSKGFAENREGLDALTPLNMYGYSKHLFDLWARRQGLLDRLASLKFFNVFGPNEYHKQDMCSVVYKAFLQVQDSGRIRLFQSCRPEYGDGEQRRDFVYVKDCADIIWWLLEHSEANGLFNVGSGRARTWNDLARAVFAALSLDPEIEYMEMPEGLRNRYQYYTRAEMRTLPEAGCPVEPMSLEAAVADYIGNYLQQDDPYLEK